MHYLLLILLSFILLGPAPANAESSVEKAQKIWKLLNGTHLSPESKTIQEMSKKITEGDILQASQIAVRAPESSIAINIIKPIFTPLAGREVNHSEPIGDFTFAWMAGILLDQKVKDFFSGAPLYINGDGVDYSSHILSYRNVGLTIFSDEEIKTLSQRKPSELRHIPVTHNLGVLTTSQYAKAIFEGGTNRRPVKKIIEDFLCVDNIETMMNFNIPDMWVGRDIPRAPGNSPKDYLNRCVGCHAGMDAARGAFAFLDFGTKLVYKPLPYEKLNINSDTFSSGRKTYDESWEHNGWIPTQPNKVGQVMQGPKDFVNLIVDSPRFYQCLVKRSHKAMCPTIHLKEDMLGQIAYSLSKKQNILDMFATLSTQVCLEE